MANTLFIGKVYHRFDELASTNDYARELLAKSKPPEGTVIRAASQSAGRGQFGSKWVSEPGANLTLSVIFYPIWLLVSEQFRLSEAVSLAIRDTVQLAVSVGPGMVEASPSPDYRLPATVKWPNDIYLGNRKIAGILIQNTLNGDRLQASVVGIGLNVNQTAFPPEAPKAGSLALATGRQFDPDAVADILFECLEKRYLQLKADQGDALRAEYQTCLLGFGEARFFARADGSTFTGVIRAVQPDGRLMIQTDHGAEVFAVKEIQML